MKNGKLKIGRIPYANLFPIFHYLDTHCDNSEYTFIKGVPSKLNKMLRAGELDISPSSSIEFLKNKNRYRILPWHSISSTGQIKSILLFSGVPLNELGGKTIAVSSASDTSVAMLKIILSEFCSLECKFRKTDLRSVRNILSSASAVLHIGDTAMMEAGKIGASQVGTDSHRETGTHDPKHTTHNSELYIYDLGELWYKYTGLPFVYALWVVRKKALAEKTDLIKKLSYDLINAKKYADRKLSLIAEEAPQRTWTSKKELVDYWNIISYDFTDRHLEGLRLFEKYALNKG
ncbi:MAG: menaquinone biosynthesis protein [Nitrospirae bacterium]|nr:menaquinone biosynthesis protein [Nitrospirota bacterium]